MLVENYVNDRWIVNALINQYLLSLGDYDLDNLNDHPQAWMCFTLFFFATFLT